MHLWVVKLAGEQAAQQMRPMVGEETTIIPLQNGVEAASQLAEVYGKQRVLGGVCRIVSMIDRPGVIRHMGLEPTIVFGELDHQPSPRSARLQQIFTRAGVNVEVPPDIDVAVWEKFLLIAPYSGMSFDRAKDGVYGLAKNVDCWKIRQRSLTVGRAMG